MEKITDFKIGLRVKMKEDGDAGPWVRGNVKEISENKVLIQWDDLIEPIQHDTTDFWMISLSN